jgi:hypothetical protein
MTCIHHYGVTQCFDFNKILNLYVIPLLLMLFEGMDSNQSGLDKLAIESFPTIAHGDFSLLSLIGENILVFSVSALWFSHFLL